MHVALSALAFIVALGILVSIHEYGHFWVARRVGIKVLRYSIGFGRALYSRVGERDGTEYVVAAIPLGGYVKMLDEREGEVAAHERHRAFNRQPLLARTAVVIAGPLANFLLAILAYWIVLMIGISGVAPLLGEPSAESPAALAGFQEEDLIVAVGETETATWQDARIALLDAAIDVEAPLAITVETRTGEEVVRSLPITQDSMLKAEGDAIAGLGFTAWWPVVAPVAGEVIAGGAAESAGMQVGDRVLRVDGEPVETWREFVALVQPRAGESLAVEVERGGERQELIIVPESVQRDGQTIGRIGVAETQSEALVDRARVVVRMSPVNALFGAVERTVDMTVLTLRMLGKLVFGEASLDNLSGPLSIAQFAGQSASIGIDHYINFIALISISLAVLNLLPIPMLDGGHLLYFAVEGLLGKPPSERVQILGQQIGIVILGGLMFVAFYNDIGRLLQ